MSATTTKAGLVILPNNCAAQSTCALCYLPGRMAIPFDVFTADGRWACDDCAAREWGSETVEALHGVGVAHERGRDSRPEGRDAPDAKRLSCTEHGFEEATVPLNSRELVRLTIRDSVSSELARVLVEHLLRRYANTSQDVPF